MIQRYRLAVIVAIIGCSLGATSTLLAAPADAPAATGSAVVQPTAAELLQQGLAQYKQGNLSAANQTLKRVDAAQLESNDQRVELTQTLQDIGRQADASQAQAKATPGDLLVGATQDVNAGNLHTAADKYKQITSSPDASAAQKQLASARLAEVQRQLLPADEKSARDSLNQAVQDLQGNRLDAAAQKLQAVKQSGVNLGWFDNKRLDRALAVLQERQAAAPKPAPIVAQEPATPEAQPQPVAVVEAPPAPAKVAEAPVQVQTPAVEKSAAAEPAATEPQSDVLAQAMSLAAQEKVAQAREAQTQNNTRLAVQYYQQALEIEPANAEARSGLDAAQASLSQSTSANKPPSILQRQIAGISIRGQAAIAEYNQLTNLAQKQRTSLNYAAALETVQQAKITLDNNQPYLPAAQYRNLRDQTNQLTSAITDEKATYEQNQKDRLAKEQAAKTRETALIAAQQKNMEVQNLLRRAQALRKEQNYDRSLQLVNQALFLDSNNYAAQAMKDIIEDSIILTRSNQIERRRDLSSAKHRLENIEATIPPTELLVYPPDWPQLSERRIAGLGATNKDSEANRIVAQKLREPIPAQFNANQLETAINFIRQITGVNILVRWSAMQLVGVERDTPISLQLSNVPASQALKYILQDATSRVGATDPISFAIYDGLVHISTESDLKTTTTYARVYDIRDLLIQVPNFDDAPSFDLSSNSSSSESVGGSSGGGNTSSQSLFGNSNSGSSKDDEKQSRVAMIKQITDLIQSTVGKPEDWPNLGGTLSGITELNGNLIIRSTPNNHHAILDLLSQLRETRAMQISIEARFLLVDREFVNDFGVDFDLTINNIGSHFGPITLGQNGFSATDAASALTGGNPALSLAASFMDDVEVNLMIRATQADQRSVQLSAPRLTIFNGQRAYVQVSTQTAYVSDLQPVPDANGFNPTVSVVNEGVVLDVEGTVSADRRYVTMTIRPSLARLIKLVSVPFIAAATNDNNNNNNNNNSSNVTISGTLQLPIIELNTVQTTVSVPDKGTILLGGQRIVNEREIEVGVPVLSKIPIINRLFTNRSVDKVDRTLLILVKPTIIIQSEEEENLFPGLNANPHQFNVGRTFQ